MRRLRPRAVLSVGGYASGPATLAAALLGVPIAVLEPNSTVGFANRVLAPFARCAFVAWDEAVPSFRAKAVRQYGVPLRPGFGPRPSSRRGAAVRVLVMGGSQGAAFLNEHLPAAFGRLALEGRAVDVLHQAGRDRDAPVRAAYERAGVTSARVVAFIDDVAQAIADADLVVARAGAGTIAEITAIGRASVLVPFPHATDDHQARNAEALARAGAAVCLRQERADPASLAAAIGRLLSDAASRRAMAEASRARGRPRAAHDVAVDLLAHAGIPRAARAGKNGNGRTRTAPEVELMFRGRVRHVHFVGIGGIGMSGLAEVLRTLDFEVSGSDLRPNENTRRLEGLGVRVFLGHAAENVTGSDVVVYSSAISPQNPEYLRARELEIPIIPRAEMLAELMRTRYAVTIAGSHGKTTTTSLVATVLRAAGLDPTVVVGGKVNALGTNARHGEGDLFVAEADESDGSFLKLTPTIAVVTNIDAEHLDHYGTHDAVKDAFVAHANRVPFYGLCVLCIDHPSVQEILPRVARRHVTYGVSRQAVYRAKNMRFEGLATHVQACRWNDPLGTFVVNMPGAHNVLNALAVIAVADELEVPLDVTREAIASFHGVQRRFTVLGQPAYSRGGQRGDVMIVDDYGHHPAEVEATLDAAQRGFDRRVVVAFQPHRYTRTKSLFDEFTRAFNKADVVVVTDVYPAGEQPIAGASGEALAEAIRVHGHHAVKFVRDKKNVAQALRDVVEPGDIVIALGAGDINASARELLAMLSPEATP